MSWNTKYEIAKRKNLTNQETVAKKYKTMKIVQMKNGNGMLWSADLRYMTPCCDMRFPWNGAMLRSADFPWNDALLWSADFREMTLCWDLQTFRKMTLCCDLQIFREMTLCCDLPTFHEMNQRSLWCLKLSGRATASNRTTPLETATCIRIASLVPWFVLEQHL